MKPADDFGPVLAGRSQAAALRERVEKMAVLEETVVDFDGVLAVSPSFADEFFAKMNPDLMRDHRISFVNVSESLAAIARFVRDGRATFAR